MRATDILRLTNEMSLEDYMKRYIKRRLERIEKSDLSRSIFTMLYSTEIYFTRVKVIILDTSPA